MDLKFSLEIIQIADWIINVAFQCTIVLVISLLIRWFCRRRSAPVRSDICLITMFLLLIIPVATSISIQLENIKIEILPQTYVFEEDKVSYFNKRTEIDPMVIKSAKATGEQISNIGKSDLNKFIPTIQKDSIIDSTIIFGSIWLIGVMIMLSRLGIGLFKSRNFRANLKQLNNPRFDRIYASAIDTLKLKQTPTVCLCSEINSPLTIGLLQPHIVLPENLCQETSDEALKSILLHELSHIYHKDHWSGLLQKIIVALYWWFPLVYSLTRQFSMEREYICDNHAVKQGNPIVFAKSLLNLAKNTYRYRQLPATLGAVTSKSALENRIQLIISGYPIMATSTNRKTFILKCLISVLLMMVLLSLNWTITAQKRLDLTATFDFIKRPVFMKMDDTRIYIAERGKIFIIDRKSYRLVKKITHKNFIKLGGIKRIDVKTENLIVSKQKSLYIFDKNTGELKSKVYDYNNHHMLQVLSMGDNLVKLYLTGVGSKIKIDICNNQLQVCNTVHEIEEVCDPKRRVCKFYKKAWGLDATKDMLVATFDREFRILRFDKSGKKLPDISREDVLPIKITDNYKEGFTKWWVKKNELSYWWLYPTKYQLELPDNFPRIDDTVHVVNQKIYVSTYESNDNYQDSYTYQFDGTFLKKIKVPFINSKGRLRSGPVTYFNNKRYQLAKDEQKWQLFTFDIE